MRALLVDDHGLFRDGLRLQLMRVVPEISVVEADSFQDGLTAARTSGPFDYAFVDLLMPGQGWQSALPELTSELKPARVVILSAVDDPEHIQEAFRHGIVGFIPKRSDRKVILNALRLILDGGSYLPPELVRPAAPRAGGDGARAGMGSAPVLTPRQTEVLELLCVGRSNKQIAYALELSEATVKLHINSLMRVLGARNRTEAAISARRLGMVKD